MLPLSTEATYEDQYCSYASVKQIAKMTQKSFNGKRETGKGGHTYA